MHSSFSPAYYKYSTSHTDGSFRDIKLLNAKFYFHISVFILLIISSQKLFVTSLYQPVGNEADFKKNFCFYKSLGWSPLSGLGKGLAVGETVTGEPGINKPW